MCKLTEEPLAIRFVNGLTFVFTPYPPSQERHEAFYEHFLPLI